MADPEHLKILKSSVTAFNKWRKENPTIEIDLTGADLGKLDLCNVDLSEADLRKSDFHNTDLRNADLSNAMLGDVDFFHSDLREANLTNANLVRANLHAAKLSGANLAKAGLLEANLLGADLTNAFAHEANLCMAILTNANLISADLNGASIADTIFIRTIVKNANFSNTEMGGTIFGDIDLSEVYNLEKVKHLGPSTIGIDTIFRSGGKIPHKFLVDAGVPDIFIEYMESFTRQAFQFYSCFISHSTKDKEFVDRLYADLRKEGVRCWRAPKDIKGGKKLHLQLYEAIRVYDKLLLILSEQSIGSDWVANEIKWARKREKQDGKQKLFPVRLIDYEKLNDRKLFYSDTDTDLSAEVRSFFIPDFTNWKDHDSYQRTFKKLLRYLQTTEE